MASWLCSIRVWGMTRMAGRLVTPPSSSLQPNLLRRSYHRSKNSPARFRCSSSLSVPLSILDRQATRDLYESMCSQTDVGLSIAKQLLSKEAAQDHNVVFSPLSIHVLLSLVSAGSQGSTLDELLSFLRSKSCDHLNCIASQLIDIVLANGRPNDGPRLSFANAVWVEQSLPLRTSFKHLVDTAYKADLASADFQNKAIEVTDEVNSWVQKKTNGLIRNILHRGSVNSLTRLILVNALYFKGAWDEKFDESITEDSDFHLLNGNSVKVPFMINAENQFISVFYGFKVLCLPYRQCEDERQFSMYLFLPDAKDGLSALIDKVCSEFGSLERMLPHERVEVGDFRIPRFKISFNFEASSLLKELGLVLPFSGGLTEMVDSQEDLFISAIFHKAFIEVNEEGTEAAAASVTCTCGASSTSMRIPPKIDFVADHPFLFLIREDMTGTVLFTGQVLNPLIG